MHGEHMTQSSSLNSDTVCLSVFQSQVIYPMSFYCQSGKLITSEFKFSMCNAL